MHYNQHVARIIDHTLLKPEATENQIKKLCEEAKTYRFASVCVHPYWIKTAAAILKGTEVKVCTVVGFPLGLSMTEVKAYETAKAIEAGATEIDMVINIGAMKTGDYATVQQDIQAVVQSGHGMIVKVILETALLSQEEITRACQLAQAAGAHFVKTSTGFSHGGATTDHVARMKEAVGDTMEVKASGGIRDLITAKEMIAAGATRLGTSASVAIVTASTSIDDSGY